MVYVSITGLRLKSRRQALRFWWHAIRSMRQAQCAPGNLRAEARRINGVHHTLSAWVDQTAMRAYLLRGAHRNAVASFGAIATGKTFGFETDAVPPWDLVHEFWLRRGIVPNK